jgi:hypothetical protein
MKLSNFMQGLEILRAFYNDPNGYHIGAEHDIFYAYATDKPLTTEALEQLVALGWFQENRSSDGEFRVSDYAPDEAWSAFT